MALIKSVKDEEERKRKSQAQANQTAQTAANKSAQMNSDAAKRNSAGASKAPTQSAADTIKAAKEKAKTGTVTKTPKQYANSAQYVKKSNPVRQTFNYETLGTQERVDQVASWIVDPKEKQGFLDGWTAYTNTKSYKNQQKRKEQLQGLSGLYDANGRTINVNTASYATVVQGIRSIADATKRKEAAAKLEEMTKTWGSRFYGQTYTKDIVTSYLGNPDFTEEDYKDEVAVFENAFYAQSGYEEQNTQAYIDSIMDIRNSGYSDSVQRQLKQRLDEVWKNTTGKKLPSLNEVSADLVNEYYERAKKQQEEEAAGDTKSWWENLIGFLGFGEEDEPEEKTEEQSTTSGVETKSSLPGGAVEMGKVASGSVVDVAPNIVSYTKPEDVSYTAQNGAVDLSSDPIKAIIQYADKGLSGSLNAATKAAIDKYVHSSAGISAMWGVLSNENLNEYAYVGEDGKIASEKGNRLASDIYRDNYGILGSKLSSYALKIKDSSFPAVLREDAAGVLSTIIQQAETEAQLLPEQYDPDFVNIYDQFLENHPSAVDALAEAFAYEGEMKRANREAQALAAAEEQANKQKAIETSVEACRTGNGTVEDWDRVAELAAKVTKDQLYDDDFYMDMLTEIGIARSMSDRDLTNLDDWYNEKTTGWLLANGVDNDLTKVPAIQYKDFLNGHVRDALDQVAATAYSLGYKSLAEYNEKTGVLSGDLLYQIAWNNIQKAEKTTTDEVVDEANRIAYKGTDDSFGRTVEGIAYGMKTGFVDQTMAEGYEAIYNFAVSTNLDVDAARVRIKYINEYGYANAASAYIDHMTQLADGGYFPSEELTNYVKQALAGDGDAFALGIMPEDMGWAVEGAKEAQQKVADYQDWAQENLTEAQGLLSSIAVSTGHNTATQLIAKGINLVFGGFGAAGQVISSMAAYGGFGGEFNETFKKSLSEHNMRESNLLGLTNSLAMAIANLETDKKFSGKVLDLLGVNTAVEMAVEEMGMPAATNIWKAMIGAFGKGTAKNLFDEVIHDEVMEGLWKNGLGAGVEYLLDATEGAVKLPNIQDVFLAGINALVNIDAIGTMEDVIGNAPEAAIYMLPMAIMSGSVDGAQEWKSYKSLKQAAKTGDPADAKQAVEDLAEDLADPEKGKALSEGVNDAKKGKVAAQIMLKDEEISPLFEQAQMDFEQAKAHEAKAEANQAAIDTAVKTMMEAQERLDNGTGDDSDAQAIVDASEAIAKNKAGLDEAKREAKQKRDAGNKLYERITNIAMAKAGKQVSDERTAATEELTTAQQEQAAQVEVDNVTALEADNFVNERYPNATPEQRKRLIEQYNAVVKGRVDSEFKSVDMAVRQFKKKFKNINFTVVDSLSGSEGGYVRDRNTVYIARDMTYGEIANRVITHELTHAAEAGGKAYEQLRDALINLRYKGDKNQLRADILSKQNRYNDHFTQNNIMDEATGTVKKLSEEEAMQEIVAQINSEILSGNEEMINRLVAEQPSVARRIWETVKDFLQKVGVIKDTEIDQLRRVESMFEKALNQAQTKQRDFGTDGIQYSIREKQPPKNVVYAYKAFYARDGKLYPPMVANITDEADKQNVKKATSGTMKSLPTPVGVWLDADVGGIMTDENGEPVRAKDTKRLRVKNDKSGGSATLAFRPGWHLGEWPDAKQFNKADPETGERGKRMPDDLVFAKCEVSADIDYQLDALSYGINEKGSFSRSQAGLPEIPEDGYYKYRTNVDPTTAPWLIAGSIKVTEILDDDDCARICAEFGVTPDKRVSGEKIDLAKYGLKRGPVEETTEGMEKFKENDANRANKALLDRALSDPNYPNAYVQRDIDFDNPAQYEQLKKEFAMNGQDIEQYKKLYETRGFASERRAQPVAESKSTGEALVGEVKGSAMQFSLRSWTDDERDTVRNNLTKRGFNATDVERWIDDVDGVARIIAADKDRLDFTAADNQVMLKPNQEYVKTLDASTLCAKRLLYQGTFNAIQHAMPDSVITSDGLIKLRNMMAEMGYETPCGICYVESRRRNLGTFAKQWLDSYDARGGYQPKLDDVTTTDGLERMRTEHPEVYKSFTDEMNRKGSNNPKVVQLRTDYRGDIRSLTKKQAEKIVEIGGLRVQSFSDFETPHLLDMMQAVLDMTDKGLTSQAYTKVPNFAAVFGDTGIKINLSLIADGNGLDENGDLVFSSYEGMDFDRAMELRDMYSKNVGTILVGVNDDHIKAAMADPRIDYIIPFHKSGWGQKQLESLTGMRDYEDYTADQNEKRVKGQTKGGKATYKNVEENFHPVDYWDYSKSGKENAEEYLRMCAEDGRIPKFSQFLKDNGDGSYSLPEDGSADGYWKLLIDFKMYDNDGVGSPQMPVMPNFNMEEAQRVLDEYEGGADSLPVAEDVVERYVNEFDGMQFSVPNEDSNPMTKQDFGAFYAKIGEMRAGKSDQFARAANGDYILAIKDKLVYTDGNWDDPSISSVVEILLDDETDIDAMREVWYEYENGNFSEDTAIAISESLHQKEVFRRSNFRNSGRDKYSAGRGAGSGSGKNSRGNERVKYSLPSEDSLASEMQAYHALQTQPEAEQAQQIPNQDQQQRPQGERQFTVKTLQNSQAVPQWLKNALYNDPQARFYEKDTNNDQIVRSWQRLQSEGYEAMRDRLLSENAQLNNADDVADANMVMAMAEHEGDVQTFLDMALHYAQEGTREAQALQARKIFSKMTPTGMKVWVSGQAEGKLATYIAEHQPVKKKVDKAAQRVADKIKDLQGGDELLRLQAASEYTITTEDAKWGVPLNEKQRALIKEYGLEKVARPGVDYYNRATTKQRMLEAILAEPNPENVTGNGLNLIQRLEYMKEGAAVITNADLDYMGRQMTLFAYSPVDDQEGRIGDLALARLYEAYGNITPATAAEKAKTWRYTAMLLSLPSSIRNVIGNAAQNTVNATAHGVAHVIDWGVSKVTGERTIAGLTMKERADGWAAFRDETINTIRDFYTDKAITSHGEDRYNLNQRGRVYQNGTLEMMRLTEGFLMSVGDRNFWKKAYVNSLAEQQRVADLNGEAFDYEAACERAEAEANYATFNEDSRVRDLLTQLKHPPEDASFKDKALAMAIDFLMPFTGVPTNITKRMIDYSPAGLAFTAIEHGVKAAQGKNFDQNAFVNGMARGLTGTALLAIGMELFKAGLVSLGTGDEEDKKIYGAETAQGRQYTPYIRIGDQYIALSTFMPAASAIIMGATAQKVFENDEDALNAIKSACFASLDMIFDASYMSSLADIFGGYGTLGENAVDSLVNSTISQNVPAILGQVASVMDPYVRDTKDKDAIMQALKSGLISKIPGLRQQLEAKVDITGEKVRNSKRYVALFDPFTRSYANDDPVLQELIDFARESGETSVIPELFVASNKYEVKVTKTQAKSLKVNRSVGENGKRDYQALSLNVSDEEKWALNEQYGKLVFGELTKLVESRKWKRADEKERAKLAKDIIAEAKLDVLEDFLKERGVE